MKKILLTLNVVGLLSVVRSYSAKLSPGKKTTLQSSIQLISLENFLIQNAIDKIQLYTRVTKLTDVLTTDWGKDIQTEEVSGNY